MPILESDIKILASQRMTDTADGGGRMTGNVIVSGVDNNMFNDISDFDRVYGNVSLRQVFVGPMTTDTDPLLGARVIIDKGPADSYVSANIFSTGKPFSFRADAANRLQSYLSGSSRYNGVLFENQVANQRSIQIFQRVGTSTPFPGETLRLVKNEGLPSEVEQYVRVSKVEVLERTFSDTSGDYAAQVVTCEIGSQLAVDFPGTAANRQFAQDESKSLLKDTIVADAGTYFGIAPLADAAITGANTVKVSSIYSQIVPASRTEVSTLDQTPAASSVVTLATAPRLVQVPVAAHTYRIKIGQTNRGYNYVYLFKPLPAPGTVRVSYRALGRWYTLIDNGDGTLGGAGTGVINYTTGSISVTLQAYPDAGSGVIFEWAEVSNFVNRSGQAGFRAPEFVFQLEYPGAIPGTVVVTWTSGGVVKNVTDAAGKFTGADMVGEVDYTSSMVFLRTLAMLDAGGQFSIAYQTSSQVTESLAPIVDAGGFMALTLSQTPVAGTVQVSWVTTRKVSSTSGSSLDETSTSKSNSTATSTAYKSEAYTTVQRGAMQSGGGGNTGIGFIQQPPVVVSGVRQIPYPVTTQTDASSGSQYRQTTTGNSSTSIEVLREVSDNGAGGFAGNRGTINYAAKTLSIKAVDLGTSATGYSNDYEEASTFNNLNGLNQGVINGTVSSTGGGGSSSNNGGVTNAATVAEEIVATTTVAVTYKTGTITPQNRTHVFTPPIVNIDLCPYTQDPVVPGSVMFTWMGTVYVDFEGKLYRGRTGSNPGILSGEMHYLNGLAIMSDYVVAGSPTAFTLNSLYTRKTGYRTSQIFGRTSAAPVRPSGFVLSVTDINGDQLVSVAGLDGQLSGPHMFGRIDYDSGVYDLLFGDYVLDTALTPAQKLEWWYSAGDVEPNGKIFVPWPVLPETLRYNVVSFFYLPLDAAILGLDPVRLPQDGRVPIYLPGRVVVIHHTAQTAPAAAAVNAGVVNVGRQRLAKLKVFGNDGLEITSGFTKNLDAGTVTFTNVAGYSQPVRVEHRVEDETVLTGVQITGQLDLLRQLTHDFPAIDTYVSSALLLGNLQAASTDAFSQQTWTNEWADLRIGDPITAQYNQVANPIVVTNASAPTERWAMIFTNTTDFRVVGESLGQIMTGSTASVLSPVNPATGTAYFVIAPAGWGSGWAAGNVLRFNTVSAIPAVQVARTVLQSPAAAPGTDQVTLSVRGGINV